MWLCYHLLSLKGGEMRRARLLTDDNQAITNSDEGLSVAEFVHKFIKEKPRATLEIVFSNGQTKRLAIVEEEIISYN